MPNTIKTKQMVCLIIRSIYLSTLTFAIAISIARFVMMGFWPNDYQDFFHEKPSNFFSFEALTNYFCYVMGLVFLADAAYVYSRGTSFVEETSYKLRFYGVVAIALSFIMKNLIIRIPFTSDWFTYMGNANPLAIYQDVIFDFVAPIMIVIDWIFFNERDKINLYDTYLALGLPALYALYVLLRSNFGEGLADRYPYYFLSPEAEGEGGLGSTGLVILALIGLAYLAIAIGTALFAADQLFLSNDEKKQGIVPVYKAFRIVGFKSSIIVYATISAIAFLVLFINALFLDLLPNDTIIVWIAGVMSFSTLLPLFYFALQYETKLKPFLRARKIASKPSVGAVESVSVSYMSGLYRELFVSYRHNSLFTIAPTQNPLPFFLAGKYKTGDKVDLYFPEIGANPIAVVREKSEEGK